MNTNIMPDLLQSNSMTILLTLFLFVLPLHLLLTRYRWVIFGKVRRTESHGGSLVADVLKAHGVRFVFTLVGGHISPLLVESKRRGIRVIDVRHEVTSVFAADAVARLTGRVGVAAVTAVRFFFFYKNLSPCHTHSLTHRVPESPTPLRL